MARKVFYSFCYGDDINRCMVVRNRWVTYGNQIQSGIIDKAEFEKIKRTGDQAVYRWINKQLEGTSFNISQALVNAKNLKSFFVSTEAGKFKINHIGEDHVDRDLVGKDK